MQLAKRRAMNAFMIIGMLRVAGGRRLHHEHFGVASRDSARKRDRVEENSGTSLTSKERIVNSLVQNRAKHAAEQVEAMMANTKFKEQLARFEERLGANQRIRAKLEKFDSRERLVQPPMSAMKSETPSLFEVSQSNAPNRGVNLWKALSALLLMGTPARAIWPFSGSEAYNNAVEAVGTAPEGVAPDGPHENVFDQAKRSGDPKAWSGNGDVGSDAPADDEQVDHVLVFASDDFTVWNDLVEMREELLENKSLYFRQDIAERILKNIEAYMADPDKKVLAEIDKDLEEMQPEFVDAPAGDEQVDHVPVQTRRAMDNDEKHMT